MTGNPLSGHTAANQASMTGSGVFTDSLEDGEHITSPSLTNMLEGVHGNGIILEEDTASSDSDRNTPEDLPGVCEQVTNSYTVRIEGGHAVIDGVVYAFAGGPGSTQDVAFTTTSAHRRATYSALTTGQEVLIVVYVSTDTTNQCITWEMGTPVTTASNTYPTTPSAFLSEPKGGLTVKQSVVLAVIRAVYSGTGGDLYLNISESNDKRIFVRPNPIYFTPVTTGAVGIKTTVDSHTALDTLHSETGNLAASRLGAMWQSYNADGDANLYYSSKDSGGTRHTHLLGPTHVDVSSPSTNQTFTFGSNQIFVLTPSTTINLNPSGTFPPGYTVFVSVPSGSTVTFDSTGLNSNVVATEATMFTYDGSAWKKVMVSGTVSPASSGASGLVQLSDGAGGFTSDANLSWQTSPAELTVNGKLTVTGLIDPTGLELAPQGANPGGVAGNTLWLDSGASNRPKIGSNAVMRASDNISELTNDAGFTDASAAASAAPVQSVNSATGAVVLDADDLADGSTNVMMTTAERTKLTGIATGATAYADADAIAAIETEAGLDFSTSSNDAIIENTVLNKDIYIKGNVGGVPTNIVQFDVSQKTLIVPEKIYTNSLQLGYGTGPAKLQVYNAGDDLEIYAAGTTGGNVKIIDITAGTDGAEANRIVDIAGNFSVSQNVGFFGTAPAAKTSVASLGVQSSATTGIPTPPGAGDTAHADFTTAINQLNTNINNLQTKLDDLITSLNNLGLV